MKKIRNILLSFLLIITTVSWPIGAQGTSECKTIPSEWYNESESKITISNKSNSETHTIIKNSNEGFEIDVDTEGQYLINAIFSYNIHDDVDIDTENDYCYQLPKSFNIKGTPKGEIIVDASESIGTWEIVDGLMKVRFNSRANEFGNRNFGFNFNGVLDIDLINEENEEIIENPFNQTEQSTIVVKGKSSKVTDEDSKTGLALKQNADGKFVELTDDNLEASHVKWKVSINTAMEDYKNVVIEDKLKGAHKLDENLFKLYKVNRKANGEIIDKIEMEITTEMLEINDDNSSFVLSLGNIKDTYELEYITNIEKQSPGSEQSILSNSISRIVDGKLDKKLSDEVNVSWREAIDALLKNGELSKNKDRIRWTIDYNLDEIDLGTLVSLKDKLSHGEILKDTIKIYEVKRDHQNGNVNTISEIEMKDDVFTLSEDSKILELNFDGKRSQAYRIIYESKIPLGYVGTIQNEVISKQLNENPVNGNVTADTKPHQEKIGSLKIDDKGTPYIHWTIYINQEHLEIGNFKINDIYNKSHLELDEDSLEVYSISKGSDTKNKVNHNGVVSTDTGFELTIEPKEDHTRDKYIIKYRTKVTDAGITESKNLENKLLVSYESQNAGHGIGDPILVETPSIEVEGPAPSLHKQGVYEYIYDQDLNKIVSVLRWEIVVNKDKLAIKDFKLTDTYSNNQKLISDYKYQKEDVKILDSNDKDLTEDFEIKYFKEENQSFEITYTKNEGILPAESFKIIYYTILEENLDEEHVFPENEVTLEWIGKVITLQETVKKDLSLKKEVSSLTNTHIADKHEHDRVLHWEIYFNKDQHVFYNFKLEDIASHEILNDLEGITLERLKDDKWIKVDFKKTGNALEEKNPSEQPLVIKYTKEKKLLEMEAKKLQPYQYRLSYDTLYQAGDESNNAENKVKIKSDGIDELNDSAVYEKPTLILEKTGKIDTEIINSNGNRNIDWEIEANEGLANLKDATIKDSFYAADDKYDHLVLGTQFKVTIKQYQPGVKEIKTVELNSNKLKDDGFELILEKEKRSIDGYPKFDELIRGFSVKLPDGRYRYNIEYQTEVISYPSFNSAGYFNRAMLETVQGSKQAEAYVPFYEQRTENSPQKRVSQDPDTDLLNWEVTINPDALPIRHAKIEDTLVGEHSFASDKLKDMIEVELVIDKNESKDKSNWKTVILEKNKHYEVTYNDTHSGMTIAMVDYELPEHNIREFKNQINHTYILSYSSEMNSDFVGETILKNQVSVNGISDEVIDGNAEAKITTEKWSYGSYSSGSQAKFKLIKYGMTHDEVKILPGVKFNLTRFVSSDNISHESYDKEVKGIKGKTQILNSEKEGTISQLRPGKYLVEEIPQPHYHKLENFILLITLTKDGKTEIEIDGNPSNINIVNTAEIPTLEVTNDRIMMEFEAEKVWEYNESGKDLSSQFPTVYFALYRKSKGDGKLVTNEFKNVTNGTDSNIKVKWKNLEKYDEEGIEYTYYVKEVDEHGNEYIPEGFISKTNTDGNQIVNQFNPDTENVSIKINKKWNDGKVNEKYEIRPSSVKIDLIAKGLEKEELVETVTLKKSNGWNKVINNLARFDKYGNPIVYILREQKVDGYFETESKVITLDNTDIDKTNEYEAKFVNTLENLTNIRVKKSWVLSNDAPEPHLQLPKVKFDLYRNLEDEDVSEAVLVGRNPFIIDSGDEGEKVWEDLEIYDLESGQKYIYSVQETDEFNQELPGFISKETTESNLITIENTWKEEMTEISLNKTWDDYDNKYHTRPEFIVISLFNKNNGMEIKKKKISFEDFNGEIIVKNLPKYDRNGYEIEYSIKEDEVEGYSTIINENNFDIINKLIRDEENITDITVNKDWVDDHNRDGLRPDSIRVYLTLKNKDGKFVRVDDGVELSAPDWSYHFTNLPKYSQGNEIIYGLEEEAVDHYNSKVEMFDITNSHDIETLNISINKQWEDGENQYGIRPNSVTVRLLGNGEVISGYEEVKLNQDNNWSYNIENLPKYYDEGKIIDYKIIELYNDGYEFSVIKNTNEHEINFEITNTELFNITVQKDWLDDNNRDGLRPDNITVRLFNEQHELEDVVLNAQNNWSYIFEGLPRFSNGKELNYSVLEDSVKYYTSTYETSDDQTNIKIINQYEIGKVNVNFKKVWQDDNDRDGIRPESIIIELYANDDKIDELVVNEKSKWQGSFIGLDEYEPDKEGVKINYSLKEKEVEGYSSLIEEISPYTFIINNKNKLERRNISVTKIWEDENNRYETRPTEIILGLYANETFVREVKLTKLNNWSYEFKDLPVNESHEMIKYKVKENHVKSYKSSIQGNMEDGYIVTNTLDQGVLSETKDSSSTNKPGDHALVQTGMGYSLYEKTGLGLLIAGLLVTYNHHSRKKEKFSKNKDIE